MQFDHIDASIESPPPGVEGKSSDYSSDTSEARRYNRLSTASLIRDAPDSTVIVGTNCDEHLHNNPSNVVETEWSVALRIFNFVGSCSPDRFEVFHHAVATVTLQSLTLLILRFDIGSPFKIEDATTKRSTFALVMCILFQCLQVAFDVFSFTNMLQKLHQQTMNMMSVWFLYIIFAVGFAGRDLVLYICTDNSFVISFNEAWYAEEKTILEVWILFLYFSISTQTAVGFGDVAPRLWVAQLTSGFQMGLRLLFEVFIIGMILSKMTACEQAIDAGMYVFKI